VGFFEPRPQRLHVVGHRLGHAHPLAHGLAGAHGVEDRRVLERARGAEALLVREAEHHAAVPHQRVDRAVGEEGVAAEHEALGHFRQLGREILQH
jgi:hypothetical protein